MTRDDMDRVTAEFVAAARRGADCGFDWLELHCAHGYLLSAFLCPLTNQRDDEYGGTLANRLRYPLEVFARDARGVAAGPADVGAHLGARLGARRQHAGRRGRDRAGVQGRRRRPHRRVVGADDARGAAGLRPHVPDAVRRPHPQRGRHRHDGGRRDLRARPRQQHPDGRTRRPVRDRPAAPRRSVLDAARGGDAGLRRRGRGRSSTSPARRSSNATSPAPPATADVRPEANG